MLEVKFSVIKHNHFSKSAAALDLFVNNGFLGL
jgi:hypothetical protein